MKKYHWNGQLIFEGEYLNGKKNGKGKKFNANGELIFEGEYLYDKIWFGKGKEYNYQGIVIFEGEYLNGERYPKCMKILNKYINY